MSAKAVEYDSDARRPRAIEELIELRANTALLRELVSRNLTVRYKRSALGFLWTMAQPAMMLIVLSLAFSHAFAGVAPSYPAFVFPGLLLWNFFAQTTTITAEEIGGGGELWRRVRFPKTALAMANLITGAVNLMLAIPPLLIILLLARRPLGAALLTLPLTLLLASAFTVGVSLIIATGALHFPDLLPLWSMLLPAVMFTAPVIYPATIVPEPVRSMLRFNPLTPYLDAFRAPLYTNSAPWSSMTAMLVLAIVSLGCGWFLFTRSADEIAYRA